MDQDPDVPEVRPPTLDDLRRICRSLDDAGARYVLIGGFAVILHGGERTTKDIDLLVDPTPDNVERLKRAPPPSPGRRPTHAPNAGTWAASRCSSPTVRR